MYIPIYTCTYVLWPLVTGDQLRPTPRSHLSPLVYWRTYFLHLFPLHVASSIFPLHLPFPLAYRSSMISLWKNKTETNPFQSHILYQLLPQFSTVLYRAKFSIVLFILVSNFFSSIVSWTLYNQAFAPTISSIIKYLSWSCLIYQQNWTKLIILFSFKHILPLVSRTIFSFYSYITNWFFLGSFVSYSSSL